MNQYTIKSFADLLVKSTQFKKLKTKEKKLLLLDRCNWYVSAIVRDNIKNDNPYGSYANLSSKILKKYLGDRNYKDIELCLKGLGIIIKNDKYSVSKFTKSVSLSKKAIRLGVDKSIVYSKKFNEKLKKFSVYNHSQIIAQPVLNKLLNNTLKLSVVEEKFHYLQYILPSPKYIEEGFEMVAYYEEENQFKMDRYTAFYDSFYALNDITEPSALLNSSINYIPTIAPSGRIYHIIASMPKLIRESLRTKSNELIWEVDMCSAQPSIIFLEWLKYANKNELKNIEKEKTLCLKLLLEGGIYKYIQEHSTFFNNLGYSNLKESILSAINAKNQPTKNNKELSRLFPNVMDWINTIKKVDGYKKVSFIGQSQEANIFVEVYKKIPEEKFALLIHDCILVKKEDVFFVKELLEDRLRELYKNVILPQHNLNKLFKENLVSISDESLDNNKRIRFDRDFSK